MEPVKSNLTNRSCPEAIGSNCVTYTGPAIPGLNLCASSTLTDVIYQMGLNSAGCCEGSFPTGNQSCYTGNWIDFTSSVPTSGTGPGFSWTINNFGFSTGIGGSPIDNPSYRWTKEGDLKMRGGFSININTSIATAFITVPCATLSSTCFPTGMNKTQYTLIAGAASATNSVVNPVLVAYIGIEYPSGIITFSLQFANPLLTPMRLDVDLGGTTLNLA